MNANVPRNIPVIKTGPAGTITNYIKKHGAKFLLDTAKTLYSSGIARNLGTMAMGMLAKGKTIKSIGPRYLVSLSDI